MEIRNRMADIVKMRCNACQDFLKMVIQPNWQQKLYDIAKDAIEHNRHADNYRPAYERMRDIGIDKYGINDMDVTFITQVVCYCTSIVSVQKQTKDALTKLRDDRNLTNHSSENEEDEELYLRGLLSLCNLKNFIRTVDKCETQIDDDARLEYRNRYIPMIDVLMDILDQERIKLIQRAKDIEKDIDRLLSCADEGKRLDLWCDMSKVYMDRWRIEKDPTCYYEFAVKASDAGIKEAHKIVTDYFFLDKKDYEEGERRLYIQYNAYETLPIHEVKAIIDSINGYLLKGNKLTEGMGKLIDLIIEQGYSLKRNEDGTCVLPSKADRKK